MFKQWLKQFLAVCLCILIVLSPLSNIIQVQAADYLLSDTVEDDDNDSMSAYYIVEGKDVSKLFDFGLYDIADLVDWVFTFRTYTVIKRYTDTDGYLKYKMYFNTPNLQFLLRNFISSGIDDGYTDETYKVEDTQWLVSVGENASTENAITKYGFNIPSYTYYGEYPKEVMSTVGIIPEPKHWWEIWWTAITSIFGASFLDAPDGDNFNTITYLNHTYTDASEYIVNFFQKYYLKYFAKRIPEGQANGEPYFINPVHLQNIMVSEKTFKLADEYNTAHKDEYEKANLIYTQYYNYYSTFRNQHSSYNVFSDLLVDTKKPINYYDSYHYLCRIPSYNSFFQEWIHQNGYQVYKMLNILEEQEDKQDDIYARYLTFDFTPGWANQWDGSWFDLQVAAAYGRLESPEDYCLDASGTYQPPAHEDDESKNPNYTACIAADLLRYDDKCFKMYIEYDLQSRDVTRTIKEVGKDQDDNPIYATDEITEYGEYTTISTDVKSTVSYSDTANYRGNTATSDNGYYVEDSSPTFVGDELTGTQYKRINYRILYVYDGDPDHIDSGAYMIDKDVYIDWKERANLVSYENYIYMQTGQNAFTEDDFVPRELQTVYHTYRANANTIHNYNEFIKYLNVGEAEDGYIYYKQCLIKNEGEDGECWSDKYASQDDEKTHLSLINVYVLSGLYKITYYKYKEYNWDDNIQLTRDEAMQVISTIQSYCGPYYIDVLTNIIKLICVTAEELNDKEPQQTIIDDDPRVMPFDTATLITTDKENYQTTDPRVELYKSHIVGGLVSELRPHFNLGIYFTPQESIIELAGKITELSVFMQQMCNFKFFEDNKLSPTTLWESGYITLALIFLGIFFLIKCLKAVIDGLKKSSSAPPFRQIIVSFLVLLLEAGFILLLLNDPQGTWETIKKADETIINLGEYATIQSMNDFDYLYGDANDAEVSYYIPYLDTWAKYNTGYGMDKIPQKIDTTKDKAELAKAYLNNTEKCALPYIGAPSDDSRVKHWAVVLMDAFSYSGRSTSVLNSVRYTTDGGATYKYYNGMKINENAYRVVDHFMAPRIEITELGNYDSDNNPEKLSVSIAKNPNYNGEFQSGILDLLVKLLYCALMCLLSFIKFMTFVWQWFMIYMFLFKFIIIKLADGGNSSNKSTAQAFLDILTPAITLIFIGLYNGLMLRIGMIAEGILGIFIILFMFWCTFKLLSVWKHQIAGRRGRNGLQFTFPKTLDWLVLLTDKKHRHAAKHYKESTNEAKRLEELDHEHNKDDFATETSDEEKKNMDRGGLEWQTRKIFVLPDGIIGSDWNHPPAYEAVMNGSSTSKCYQIMANWYSQYMAVKTNTSTNMIEYDRCYRSLVAHPEYGKLIAQLEGRSIPNEQRDLDHSQDEKHTCAECTFGPDTVTCRQNNRDRNNRCWNNYRANKGHTEFVKK